MKLGNEDVCVSGGVGGEVMNIYLFFIYFFLIIIFFICSGFCHTLK